MRALRAVVVRAGDVDNASPFQFPAEVGALATELTNAYPRLSLYQANDQLQNHVELHSVFEAKLTATDSGNLQVGLPPWRIAHQVQANGSWTGEQTGLMYEVRNSSGNLIAYLGITYA